MRVTVVDSGMGNIHSVEKALRAAGGHVLVTSDPEDVESAERLVLPGVGAFAENVKALVSRDLWNPVRDYVKAGLPFLGICVGMQLLMEESEEFGSHKGFGAIPGVVRRIDADKVPHVGWSGIYQRMNSNMYRHKSWTGTPLDDIESGSPVYFVNSYAASADGPDRLAYFNAGTSTPRWYAAAVRRGQVWGTQFHPEKSGEVGLAILRRWINS